MHEVRIDLGVVKKLEEMTRISLTREEEERMLKELNKILEWMRVLLEAEVEAEPLYHPAGVEGYRRRDEPKPGLPREEALKNAVEVVEGFVKAPKLVED